MIRVYLDDVRDIPVSKGFTGARNVEKAMELLKNNKVEILSLDHDLGEDIRGNELLTGYDLVLWICNYYEEYNLYIEKIYIHSDNPVGREKMLETLKGAQRRGFIHSDMKLYHYPYTENRLSDKGEY